MAFDDKIRVRMELVDKTTAVLNRIQHQFSKLNTKLATVAATTKTVTTVQHEQAKAIKQTDFAVRDLVSSLGLLAAAYTGVKVAKKAMDTSDVLVSTKARLSLITDNPADLTDQIYQMSQHVRADFIDMAGTIGKMGINVGVGDGQWFQNTDQLVKFNELLAKTLYTGGQNPKEIAAAMLQLTQAMSSGRLQGDEFRSMFENSPLYIKYVGEYMAKLDNHVDEFGNVIGYTGGQLKEMAAESKITTDIMINAMLDAEKQIDSDFAQMPKRFADRFAQMANVIKKEFDPLSKAFSKLLSSPAMDNFINQFGRQLSVIFDALAVSLTAMMPVLELAMNTWELWSPIALALGAAIVYVVAKTELANMGFTKLAIKTKLLEYKTTALTSASKGLGIVQKALTGTTYGLGISQTLLKYITWELAAATSAQGRAELAAQVETKAMLATIDLYSKIVNTATLMTKMNTIATVLNTMVQKGGVAAKIANIIMTALHIKGLTAEAVALGVATTAATAFNAALFYVIIPLTLILGVVWLVVKAFNAFTGSSFTLVGVIHGTLLAALALLYDALVPIYNIVVATANGLSMILTGHKTSFDVVDFKNPIEEFQRGLHQHEGTSWMNYPDSTVSLVEGIKTDTDKIADNTSTNSDYLKFMRDVAEARVANRLNTINVNITNNNAMTVNDDRDLDGVVNYITKGLADALDNEASGVHL